jgi:hypothetical protein
MIILGANLAGSDTVSAQIDIGPGHFVIEAIIDGSMLTPTSVIENFDLEADHTVVLTVRVGERAVRFRSLEVSIFYVGQNIYSLPLSTADFGLGNAVELPAGEVISSGAPVPFNIAQLADEYGVPLPLDRIAVGRFTLGLIIRYDVQIGSAASQSTATAATANTLLQDNWVTYTETINFDVVIPTEPTDFIATIPGAVGTTSGVVTIAVAGKAAATGSAASINPAPRTAGIGLAPTSSVAPTGTGIEFIGERMPAAARGSVTRRITGATKKRVIGERCPQCGVAWPKEVLDLELCPGCSNNIDEVTAPATTRVRNISLRALGLLATLGIIPIYDMASQLDISELEAVQASEILEESGLIEGTAMNVKGVTGSMAKASIPSVITTFFYAQLTGLAAMDLLQTLGMTIASIIGFTLLGMIISKIRKPKVPKDVQEQLKQKAAESGDTTEGEGHAELE